MTHKKHDPARDWLAAKTYHHSVFWDLKHLVKQKLKMGMKISLCIPTFNEEATIGKEILLFRSELLERYPLLDEIAVIDSGSTDRTREVAASFGADVYRAADILPECGHNRGKGENLWKAIYQLKGDVIVYVDADIKNIHPRFVYGLVGPLICDPDILYVKGFYDRPMSFGSEVRPSGGGRVTEILVRPLFSAFFPELSAIIQPLSGEYAVRRQVLQEITFPVGYGVETSHILEVYRRWGIGAFGQVDLDRRLHRNQSTTALGRMSFGILQSFFNRMNDLGIVNNLPEIGELYRFVEAIEDRFELKETRIHEIERPPMITIDAYREKFGITG